MGLNFVSPHMEFIDFFSPHMEFTDPVYNVLGNTLCN